MLLPPDAEHGACGSVLQMLPSGALAFMLLLLLPMLAPTMLAEATDVVGEVAPATWPTPTPSSSSWARMVGKC